jgi:hypothetical protein
LRKLSVCSTYYIKRYVCDVALIKAASIVLFAARVRHPIVIPYHYKITPFLAGFPTTVVITLQTRIFSASNHPIMYKVGKEVVIAQLFLILSLGFSTKRKHRQRYLNNNE